MLVDRYLPTEFDDDKRVIGNDTDEPGAVRNAD